MNVNSVLKAFIKFYPKLKPSAIYKIDNGFLIFAPLVENGTDYSNPYYFLDSKLSIANPFSMKNRKQMFAAFKEGPIWEKLGG